MAIAVVYLPPLTSNQEMETFYAYSCYSVDTLVSESMETAFIVTRDFNPNSNNLNEKRLKTLCGLKQVVRLPTREGATLDLIFSNVASFYTNPLSLARLDFIFILFNYFATIYISGHVIIQSKSKDVKKSINRIRKMTVRLIKDYSLQAFEQWINSYDWSIVTSLPTVNHKLEMFTQVINSSVDTYFPKRTVKFHHEDKPFITEIIKTLIVNRDKAFARGDKQKFILLRNKVRNEITMEKQKFCRSK
jgi:hypothetical protein